MSAGQSSAEEFFSRRVADAQVLVDAARRHAADGDAVAALAAMIASDSATLQVLLWERINVAPRAPQRQLFQAAAALTEALEGPSESPAPAVSVADLIASTRSRMLTALDDRFVAEVRSRWADVGFLQTLSAPDRGALDAARVQRTSGLPVPAFVAQRRADAGQRMLEAQSLRVRGATSEAIAAAYDSDFMSLEAYLADSAWAAGDPWLLTVVSRWDIVVDAVAQLDRLPGGFIDAIHVVRHAMTSALGDADGARLAEAFQPI